MKKLFQVNANTAAVDYGLLILRVGIGLMMLTHGLPKMEKLFSGDPVQFASVFGLSPVISLGLAVFAEVFCAFLIVFGLATRLSAIPLMITMLVAVLSIHGNDPFAQKEMAALYLVGFSAVLLAGPGRFSLDYLVSKRARLFPALN